MLKLLRYLWQNEDGFFGIGEGPSSQEKQQYGALGSLASFATNLGEKDLSLSSDYFSDLLSGDPTKVARAAGPQIGAINKQAQEERKTLAELGGRGGGTGASLIRADDATRSRYDALVSELRGGAAGALGAMGGSALATGAAGHESAFSMAKIIHDQRLAKWNDIFKSISQVASAVFGGGATTHPFAGMTPGEISGSFGGPTEATPSISTLPDETIS